jgi:hypothetical protein
MGRTDAEGAEVRRERGERQPQLQPQVYSVTVIWTFWVTVIWLEPMEVPVIWMV